MVKLAVIVGHTKKAPGASTFNKVSEYVWNGKVASLMKSYAKTLKNIEVEVFFRDKAGVAGAAKEAKKWGATHCIELHFNAAASPAYGCEILTLAGDKKAAEHADILSDLLAKKFGVRERRNTKILSKEFEGDGVFETTKGNNGNANLRAVVAAGIKSPVLIEPTFMNFKTSESEKFDKDQAGYAKLMVDYYAGVK